jgi:hypothetical protein
LPKGMSTTLTISSATPPGSASSGTILIFGQLRRWDAPQRQYEGP